MNTQTNDFRVRVSDALQARKDATSASDQQLATQIGKMSETVINHIRLRRWKDDPKMVSAEMFQRVAAFLNIDYNWTVVKEDYNFKKVFLTCAEAQMNSDSYAVSAPPGMSKTEAASDYARRKNVFFLACSAHWTKKVFLEKMLQAMGERNAPAEGMSQKCDRIVARLNSSVKPLVILDEADKLNDRIFQFFITLYNDTYTNCGFVFLGSVFFELHVNRRVQENGQGYAEFYSRIGREFTHLLPYNIKHENKTKDGLARIAVICKANGLKNEIDIQEVFNTCDGDMRKVKRLVQNFKKKEKLQGQLRIDTVKEEEVAA